MNYKDCSKKAQQDTQEFRLSRSFMSFQMRSDQFVNSLVGMWAANEGKLSKQTLKSALQDFLASVVEDSFKYEKELSKACKLLTGAELVLTGFDPDSQSDVIEKIDKFFVSHGRSPLG